MASDVEFRLLGAVEFRIDGRWHSVVPFRSRQVLALLLCARRGVVLTERIVDALWGDDMPLTPSGLVRNYVMKLRRALPASASIITRNGGYQLDVDPETVDAVRFERCLQQARRSSDGVRAEELLEEALSYWRGPALADARHSAVLEAEARAMEELRLTAQQQRVELLVERASFAEAVSELRPLLASHLDWEHLSELAMVALARDGRPAEALDAFARFCDHRRSRLGLDPSDLLLLALPMVVEPAVRTAGVVSGAGWLARSAAYLPFNAGTAMADITGGLTGAVLPSADQRAHPIVGAVVFLAAIVAVAGAAVATFRRRDV